MTKVTKKRLAAIIGSVLGMCFAMIALIFIPFIVNRMFDREVNIRFHAKDQAEQIVSGWTADRWSTDENGVVEADIYGIKTRQCSFVEDWNVSALAYVDGKFQEVAIDFLDDPSPGSTRPPGEQFFGRWQFTPPKGKRIQAGGILVVTAHDCGGEVALIPGSGPFFYPG